jgi:hypothetical protein
MLDLFELGFRTRCRWKAKSWHSVPTDSLQHARAQRSQQRRRDGHAHTGDEPQQQHIKLDFIHSTRPATLGWQLRVLVYAIATHGGASASTAIDTFPRQFSYATTVSTIPPTCSSVSIIRTNDLPRNVCNCLLHPRAVDHLATTV